METKGKKTKKQDKKPEKKAHICPDEIYAEKVVINSETSYLDATENLMDLNDGAVVGIYLLVKVIKVKKEVSTEDVE